MTSNCPICRSPVEVDDSKLTPEGVKAQCPLCDEVFLVRSAPAAGMAPQAPPVSSRTQAGTPSAANASASRKLLEEDVEGAHPRVLVAHDSHAFGDVVRVLLEEEGFDVEVVHDGDAAHKTILDHPPGSGSNTGSAFVSLTPPAQSHHERIGFADLPPAPAPIARPAESRIE